MSSLVLTPQDSPVDHPAVQEPLANNLFHPPLVSNQSLSPLDRASQLKTDRDVSEPEFLSFVASCEFPGTQETR